MRSAERYSFGRRYNLIKSQNRAGSFLPARLFFILAARSHRHIRPEYHLLQVYYPARFLLLPPSDLYTVYREMRRSFDYAPPANPEPTILIFYSNTSLPIFPFCRICLTLCARIYPGGCILYLLRASQALRRSNHRCLFSHWYRPMNAPPR